MAEHVVTVKYDRKLVSRAINRFVFYRLGNLAMGGLFVSTIVILVGVALDYRSICFLIIGVCWMALMRWLEFVTWRAERGFFEKCNDRSVVFTFSDNGVKADLPEATSEFEWPLFNEILKLKAMWLLVYAKSRYLMLPTANLTPECMQFIEKKIEEVKQENAA